MPQFRNILNRKPAIADGNADNNETSKGHQNPELLDSPRSGSLNIRKSREEVPEYKLSVVNDSGVYLPPSPPEKQSFWSRTSKTTPSTNNHRNLVDENEPFSISRESFDSYRRSFDISAKSPVQYSDSVQSRTSLDSRFSRLGERPSMTSQNFTKPRSMEEDVFEDVGLADEDAKPKRRGLFSRFGDNSSEVATNNSNRPSSSHLGFRLPGRKRGQSGQGSELGNYKQEMPPTEA